MTASQLEILKTVFGHREDREVIPGRAMVAHAPVPARIMCAAEHLQDLGLVNVEQTATTLTVTPASHFGIATTTCEVPDLLKTLSRDKLRVLAKANDIRRGRDRKDTLRNLVAADVPVSVAIGVPVQ